MTNRTQFNAGPEPRKATRLNLENLYALLMHLIKLSTVDYKNSLLGFSGIVYNRILYEYGINVLTCIAELKLVRRWYLEYIRNGDLTNPGIPEHRWDESHRCPNLLVGLHSIYRQFEDSKDMTRMNFFNQILFSLLSADRVMIVPVRANHTTITDRSTAAKDQFPTREEIISALAALGITPAAFKAEFKSQVHDFDFEVLSSRGPNGDGTWTAHTDARAWSSNPSLFSTFKAFLEECGLTRILKNLLGCIKVPGTDAYAVRPLLGKLAYIEEWGGKNRIVAQLDYWTQMALTPLHNSINVFLRRLDSDGTFDQQRIAELVRKWTSETKDPLYSYDLTAATDRLPIEFQIKILDILMGSSSFGVNWGKILIYRTYLTENGDHINYNTGQPMGARSSFPMLALTHHVIVQIAAKRANVKPYSKYVVLGDDVTLSNNGVASQYAALMAVLGVPINLTKSIVHVDGGLPMAEICKRVFMAGTEISMFNPKLLVNAAHDGRLGPELQNDLHMRGWNPGADVFWRFMAGVLDRDNLVTLLRLNIVPTAISGLHSPIQPNTKLTAYSSWVPSYPELKAKDLIELFTYVVASEQLKRLDAILRATVTINDAISMIAASAGSAAIPMYVRDTWLHELLTDKERKNLETILAGAGPITPNHPIVLASRAEANRISELLHSLNALDTAMVERARLGLLDMFRTSVSTIWLNQDTNRASVGRALFTRMLSTLVSVFTNPRRVHDGVRNLTLSYSVVLTTIGRLWSVSFTFGAVTTVNALRAGVTRNIMSSDTTLADALGSISIIPSTENHGDPTISSTGTVPKGRAGLDLPSHNPPTPGPLDPPVE